MLFSWLIKNQDSDEMLWEKYIKEQDINSITLLIKKHQKGIYNFLYRYLGNVTIAEDLTQEVFLRVVQKKEQFQLKSKFTTWVYVIARNIAIDYLRVKKHKREESLDNNIMNDPDGNTLHEKIGDPHKDVAKEVIENEIRIRIEYNLNKLPEEQREVFILKEINGLKFVEISDIIGVPESTVKSRLKYALDKLQDALKDYKDYDGNI